MTEQERAEARLSKQDFERAPIFQSPIPVGWTVKQYSNSLDREEQLQLAYDDAEMRASDAMGERNDPQVTGRTIDS